MNKTTFDIKCSISNSTILDKNELSLKRETMSQVYVSFIFTRGQPLEERTSCCSNTHRVVNSMVKSRLEISEEQIEFFKKVNSNRTILDRIIIESCSNQTLCVSVCQFCVDSLELLLYRIEISFLRIQKEVRINYHYCLKNPEKCSRI